MRSLPRSELQLKDVSIKSKENNFFFFLSSYELQTTSRIRELNPHESINMKADNPVHIPSKPEIIKTV